MNVSCTKWMLAVGMYEWMWVCRHCGLTIRTYWMHICIVSAKALMLLQWTWNILLVACTYDLCLLSSNQELTAHMFHTYSLYVNMNSSSTMICPLSQALKLLTVTIMYQPCMVTLCIFKYAGHFNRGIPLCMISY